VQRLHKTWVPCNHEHNLHGPGVDDDHVTSRAGSGDNAVECVVALRAAHGSHVTHAAAADDHAANIERSVVDQARAASTAKLFHTSPQQNWRENKEANLQVKQASAALPVEPLELPQPLQRAHAVFSQTHM
jgi:hypothetical protein